MISRPLTKSEIAEIPVGTCWAPMYMDRKSRRALDRKNPNLKKLFSSMAQAKTLDVRDIEEDKEILTNESTNNTTTE